MFVFIGSAQAQNKEIMGYLPYYQFDEVDNIEFDKLSQLCIAFANPTADTSIILENTNYEDYDYIVDLCHEQNIEVYISLAGGAVNNPEYQWWTDYTEVETLAIFVSKIMNYCRMHNLDGVDFDLEWNLIEDVGENYEGFVLMLADSLWDSGKKIMGTFPGTYRYDALTDICLETFDQVNLMSYNLTGPWAPNNPGPHAPYSFAVQSINYWKAQGIESERLILGVPFYGFDFSDSPVSSFTYAHMVNQNTDYAYLDQVEESYYNGIPTIKDKTVLAMEEANGIMIWELGQDHYSEYSLLNAIYEKMYTGISLEEKEELVLMEAYPNPLKDILHINNHFNENAEYHIQSISGQIIRSGNINSMERAIIYLNDLPSGIYILQAYFEKSGKKQSIKILKI
jgi:GH18 family chitinase